MQPLSLGAKNLRCLLTVLAAMLAPLGAALARSQVNWPATIVLVSTSGIIAWRAWLDQSLSHDDAPTPDQADEPTAPVPSPQPSPLSKAVLSRS